MSWRKLGRIARRVKEIAPGRVRAPCYNPAASRSPWQSVAMKRARWLVMFDSIFAGLLSLLGFLFGLMTISEAQGAAAGLGWLQVLMAIVMMFASHFIMRTAFRRGVALTPADVARAKGFRIVPVLLIGIIAAQWLAVRSLGTEGLGAFGWDLFLNIGVPMFVA